jgi:hypothetical protein
VGFPALSLTCTADGLAHLVSDDAAAAGIAAGRGTYGALCGHTIRVAALVSATGRPCARCALLVEMLERQATLPSRHRRRRGGAWLRRLLGHPAAGASRTGTGHWQEHRRAI